MGRKSRKKSNRLPKWMSKNGVDITPATELEEQMVNLDFDNGYYTEDEKFELDNFLWEYAYNITGCLGTAPGPFIEVTSTEAMKEAEGYTLWNGQKLTGIMGKEQENLLGQIDVLKVLLAAEALKKGFENVLLYVRFLYSIIIEHDEESGDTKLVDVKEQDRLRHYLHSYWMLRKRGVFVHQANEKSTHVWKIPEQGKNKASNLFWY